MRDELAPANLRNSVSPICAKTSRGCNHHRHSEYFVLRLSSIPRVPRYKNHLAFVKYHTATRLLAVRVPSCSVLPGRLVKGSCGRTIGHRALLLMYDLLHFRARLQTPSSAHILRSVCCFYLLLTKPFNQWASQGSPSGPLQLFCINYIADCVKLLLYLVCGRHNSVIM